MKSTLFTVGPVEMYPATLAVGGEQLPYFRTKEFSELVLDCDRSLQSLVDAPAGSRTILLTASGTGAMEAAAINLIAPGRRALVVTGGSFGDRFCEICEDNGIPFDAIRLEPGRTLDVGQLEARDLTQYAALLINAHETSTGVLYDIPRIGELCRKNGLLFIVDAISAFLCDPLSMAAMGIDLLITSSQKALALAPGLSIMVLSPRAVDIVSGAKVQSHYFGLKKYLLDATRGQTPFTPAVGVILQLHERLRALEKMGGAEAAVRQKMELAAHFRASIAGLPYIQFAETPSNALTALSPLWGASAHELFVRLNDEYGLVVTPNGGKLKDKVFRVGHMGNLGPADLDALAQALAEVCR